MKNTMQDAGISLILAGIIGFILILTETKVDTDAARLIIVTLWDITLFICGSIFLGLSLVIKHLKK